MNMMEPTTRFTSPAEYWMLVREKKALILVPAVLALVIGVVVAYALQKKFTASTTFYLKDRSVIRQLYQGYVYSSEFDASLATIQEEMRSTANISKIAGEIPGMRAYANPESPAWESLVQEIRQSLVVSVAQRKVGDDSITITFTWSDPRHCYQFVNRLAESYQDKNVSSYRESIRQKRDQLASQQREIENAIANVRERIREFDDDHFQEINFEERELSNRIRDNDRQLSQYRLDLATYTESKARLDAEILKTNEKLIETRKKANPRHAALTEAVARLEQQVAEYAQKYTEKHKNLMEARENLEKARVQLENEKLLVLDSETVIVNPEFTRLNAERRDLETKIAVTKTQITSLERDQKITNDNIVALPALRARKRALEEEKGKAEAQLAQVTGQLTEVELFWDRAKDIGATLYETLEIARMPLSHSSPQRPLIIAIALGLGLGAGLLLVFASEFTRKSFATLGEVRQSLPVPIVGAIGVLEGEDVRKTRRRRRVVAALAAAIVIFMAGSLFLLAWAKPDLLPGFIRDTLGSVRQWPG